MRYYDRLLFLAILSIIGSTASRAQSNLPMWQPTMLTNPAAWSIHMNDGLVTTSNTGLRVQIAPGKTWSIAAAPGLILPPAPASIKVHVANITPGAHWLVRLYGKFRGHEKAFDFSPFSGMNGAGTYVMELDPRLLQGKEGAPDVPGGVMVQLGLEGPAGARVEFDNVEFVGAAHRRSTVHIPGQISLPTVDLMPNLPTPYKMLNWKAVTHNLDNLLFNTQAKGEYLPFVWIDKSHVNMPFDTFGVPSYVGDAREKGGGQEGVTCIGAVLGPSLVGIDKRHQQFDWVRMCEGFWNTANGSNLVLNLQNQPAGGSFWYEIWPHIAFYGLVDRYPGVGRLDEIMRVTAGKWADAADTMNYDFNHTAYNFATRLPVNNGQWKEPDAAAGIAWMEMAAWEKFKDTRSLDCARKCLDALNAMPENPYYENLLPWGVLAAARMNAETGAQYNLNKLINWCFDISDTRGGWAVTVQNWGGYDCHGLLAGVDNRGGYAFAMNTYAQAAALTPIARYDVRYARALGKWLLNAANAARLFYPKELPASKQSSVQWKGDPLGCIAYEGLRREWDGKSPYATGDPVLMKWGPKTDIGIYGSAYVGMLGAIVQETDVLRILQLDCLATDFFHGKAYPTSLIYNPYPQAKRVKIHMPGVRTDLYDAVTDTLVNTSGRGTVNIPADHAMVLVAVPHGAKRTVEGAKVLFGGIPVRFSH